MGLYDLPPMDKMGLYDLPPNTKVFLREEVKLYTLINFFAAVGGYLGLLFGESLLSYIIRGSKWFQILKRIVAESLIRNPNHLLHEKLRKMNNNSSFASLWKGNVENSAAHFVFWNLKLYHSCKKY